MIFRRFARILNILCIVLYLPVVLGSGECVALCFEPDGSLVLDYTHRCSIADYSSKPDNATGMNGVFSSASFSEPVNARACRDIPLAIGNHTHFAPEINHLKYPVLSCGVYPVRSIDALIRTILNSRSFLLPYPLSFSSSHCAGNLSVLII